jgi:hypothetical protein
LQIYFSPEVIKPESHVLNVVDQNQKAVGYVAFLFDEKKLYVYGSLEDEGVGADFKDLVNPYIQGLAKAKQDLEVYSYLSVGGKKIELDSEDSKENAKE